MRRIILLCAVAAIAACGDIASPQRTHVYDWRMLVSKTSGGGIDTLSFHWPDSLLPVRFWVQDSVNMPARVQRAIDTWQGAFLYGEFRGTIVSDSSAADVIVRPSVPPPEGVRLDAMASECSGATDLDIQDDLRSMRVPVRVYVTPKFDIGAAGADACMDLTTIHEVGHAIGIWRHSTDPADIMFPDPAVAAPSQADRETVEHLYHVTPNVKPLGR